jgi:hypothetical protein
MGQLRIVFVEDGETIAPSMPETKWTITGSLLRARSDDPG